MVDTSGRPYEIVVTESAGDDAFHRASVRALEKSIFEPARIDGQPVDAGHYLVYHFEVEGGVGLRSRFVSLHKLLMNTIEKGDREKADKRLSYLAAEKSLNLSEDAYLHVAKYSYYAKWGDEEQQLKALDRAVGHWTAEARLPEVPGDFGDHFTWSYNLFKDEFLLEDVQGQIEEIKLRCAKDYAFFRFDPDIQYKTASDQQPCHMQLIGDPETTFNLIQF